MGRLARYRDGDMPKRTWQNVDLRRAAAAAVLVAALSGCGSGGESPSDVELLASLAGVSSATRTVRVRVTDAEGAAVRAALVRAIALDAGAAPLPVSLASLEEYQHAVGFAGATDDRGEVELELHVFSSHSIEVMAPLGDLGEEGVEGSWRLGVSGGDLTRTSPGRFDLRLVEE